MPSVSYYGKRLTDMAGGETIKAMQTETGCKINVSQASGADIEREIGLVGTRQAIEDAKRVIWDKVDQVVCLNPLALFPYALPFSFYQAR